MINNSLFFFKVESPKLTAEEKEKQVKENKRKQLQAEDSDYEDEDMKELVSESKKLGLKRAITKMA